MCKFYTTTCTGVCRALLRHTVECENKEKDEKAGRQHPRAVFAGYDDSLKKACDDCLRKDVLKLQQKIEEDKLRDESLAVVSEPEPVTSGSGSSGSWVSAGGSAGSRDSGGPADKKEDTEK